MNKPVRVLVILVLLAAVSPAAMIGNAQGKKNFAGEEFFIVAAVDSGKSQLLLKRPTEVTVLVKINDRTKLLDERGKKIKIADLRAGDTIWAAVSGPPETEQIAVSLRKGPMTVLELHRLYVAF